jgi:hypothetical protein
LQLLLLLLLRLLLLRLLLLRLLLLPLRMVLNVLRLRRVPLVVLLARQILRLLQPHRVPVERLAPRLKELRSDTRLRGPHERPLEHPAVVPRGLQAQRPPPGAVVRADRPQWQQRRRVQRRERIRQRRRGVRRPAQQQADRADTEKYTTIHTHTNTHTKHHTIHTINKARSVQTNRKIVTDGIQQKKTEGMDLARKSTKRVGITIKGEETCARD